MKEWNNVKQHPIVGGVFRSWEDELEIKDNIKQRKGKKLKDKQDEK
mgnify:CR=1 FL=1